MDVNYDNGLFELHNAVIKKVNVLKDGIVLHCVFMEHERVCLTFRTEGSEAKQPILDLEEHIINYMSVDKDGYKLYLLGQKKEVVIKASSYSVEWG